LTARIPARAQVGDAWKQLAQLDGGREFASLLVDSADRRSLSFGDNEHRQSMVYVDYDGKSVGVLAQQRFRRMPAIWTLSRYRRAGRSSLNGSDVHGWLRYCPNMRLD
jgi:hypothetical protein